MAATKKPTKRVKAGTSNVSAESRRAAFVEAYLCNGNNIAEAARTAGFSAKTAHAQGARLLKDVRVSTVLEQRRTEIAQINELSTNEIMADMARTLRFDPRKLFEQNGQIKRIVDMDDDTALCLTGIDIVVSDGKDGEGSTTTHKLKWDSKATARDQALKVFGLYEKDNKQKAGALDGLPRELVKLMIERLQALSGNLKVIN